MRGVISLQRQIGAGVPFPVCLHLLGGGNILGDSVAGSHLGQ